jgi:hypothetical protein
MTGARGHQPEPAILTILILDTVLHGYLISG